MGIAEDALVWKVVVMGTVAVSSFVVLLVVFATAIVASVVVFLAVSAEVVGPVLLKADVVVCTLGVRCKDAIVWIVVFMGEVKMVLVVVSCGAVTSVVGIVVALGTVESVSVCCGIDIVVVF